MSEQLLLKLNPILNCDRLPDYQQVCAGRGLFTPSRCVETLRITPELDECRQIIGTTGLTVDQIQRLNPDIDCQTKLEHGNLG
uniref:LysM domain-containing protein n=1 Tax=Caenorhabditis japonica TaxID=281687 RepID=A0A8R1HNJ5_CAEJA